MQKFIDRIEWSSDWYNLERFLKLFPSLPQVVKVRNVPSLIPRTNKKQTSYFDEILVLHSVRNTKIIRASDSSKNEFYLPLDTKTRVEVVWKDYKKVYDSVVKLSEDFPAYVLVMEGHSELGINKGDVLKLKQKITSRDNRYLQCTVENRKCDDINIPFGYKGLFKTLGDFKEEHVLLSDAIQHCRLPRIVKFIDNKLKMKKVDGLPSQPLISKNQGDVTLHEVISYADVIACKTIIEDINCPETCVMTIPLDSSIEVLPPSALSRSDSRYFELCASINRKISTDMLNKIAIQKSHWLVYEMESNYNYPENQRLLSMSSPSPNSSKPQIIIRSITQVDAISITTEQQPPLPPRIPIPTSQQKGYHRSSTLQPRRGSHPSIRKTQSLTDMEIGSASPQRPTNLPANEGGSSPITQSNTKSMLLELSSPPPLPPKQKTLSNYENVTKVSSSLGASAVYSNQLSTPISRGEPPIKSSSTSQLEGNSTSTSASNYTNVSITPKSYLHLHEQTYSNQSITASNARPSPATAASYPITPTNNQVLRDPGIRSQVRAYRNGPLQIIDVDADGYVSMDHQEFRRKSSSQTSRSNKNSMQSPSLPHSIRPQENHKDT